MLPASLLVPVLLAFTYPPRAPITAQSVPGASLRLRRASVAVATETRPKFTSLLGKVLGTRTSDESRSAANGNLPEVTPALGLADPWPGRDLAWKNAELEALFFSFDMDSDGYLERTELENALLEAGYPLSTEQVAALFSEYCSTRIDADKGDVEVVDLEAFKILMMSKVGVRPERDLRFAMDLFAKYDDDDSGTIDKFEFKEIVRDIKVDNDRRTVLQLASAVVGSLVVAEFSAEFQWAQKVFRPLYIEARAEQSQRAIFPTAMLSGDVDAAVASTLAARGFTAKNTLLAHSVCSDEVNGKDEQLVNLMVKRWGEGFALGGLGGLPFAGKSGFRAYLHHVPDDGKLLVMFAPHVGIDGEGRIGALQRDGQSAVSKACGAAIGAFKAAGAKQAAVRAEAQNVLSIDESRGKADEEFDPQLQQISALLQPKLEGIEDSANEIGFVTYQMYGIVRDLIEQCISQTPDVWEWTDEVAIVGGIIINRKSGGDFYQPLLFESRAKDRPAVDLFEQTFGRRPDLSPILGSYSMEKEVYGSSQLASLTKALRSSLGSSE